MSVADPIKQGPTAADQRAYEPSMEEILASIRRIISDDQSLPGRGGELNQALVRNEEVSLRAALGAPTPRASVPPSGVEPSLAPPDAPPVQTERDAPRVVATATSLGTISAPQFAMPDLPRRDALQPSQVPEADGGLLRFEPQGARRGSLPREPAAVVAEARPDATHAASSPAPQQRSEETAMSGLFSASTDQTVTAAFNTLAATRLVDNDEALRDMASDMIRPLLKSWLDENLPNLVERLVRDEIERVGRGR